MIAIVLSLLLTGWGGPSSEVLPPRYASVQTDTLRLGAARFLSSTFSAGVGEASMAIAEVTGDSHTDLLVLSEIGGTLTVFVGDGRGGLNERGSFEAGQEPTDLAIGDLDEDGHPDVLIANHETEYLTILWGLGDGTFDRSSRLPIAVGPHPHAVLIRDVNQDGLPDITVDHRQGEGIVVIDGLGGGRFRTPGVLVPTGGDPYLGFAAADLNQDGLMDLVTPNPRDLGLALQHAGGWSEPIRLQAGFAPGGVALGDFNGDGGTDILAISGDGATGVRVLYAEGTAQFRSGALIPVGRGMKKGAVGDLDGDGFDDAIAVSWNGAVKAVRGGPERVEAHDLSRGGNPWGIVIGDLNGDGHDDFAIADGAEARIEVFVSVR